MTTLEINNQSVEEFLFEQAKQTKQSATDFLMGLIYKEMEAQAVKKDIQTINQEMKLVNQGAMELESLDSLIKELND